MKSYESHDWLKGYVKLYIILNNLFFCIISHMFRLKRITLEKWWMVKISKMLYLRGNLWFVKARRMELSNHYTTRYLHSTNWWHTVKLKIEAISNIYCSLLIHLSCGWTSVHFIVCKIKIKLLYSLLVI